MGFEITRVTAVVSQQRNLKHIWQESIRLINHKMPLLTLFLTISTVSMAAVLLVKRWLTGVIPISWWLLSFLVLQVLSLARDGVWLIRRSGQVTIALSHLEINVKIA
jgi:hypothetical protein